MGARKKRLKKIVVAVSGGFDPVHVGHVRLFKEARSLGDELVIILNNDNWLKKKKGMAFMPEKERKEVLKSMKWVDRVFLTRHPRNAKDMSVKKELEILRPHIFANGGDRGSKNTPELELCRRRGILAKFNVGEGGKIQSSSWLINKAKDNKK